MKKIEMNEAMYAWLMDAVERHKKSQETLEKHISYYEKGDYETITQEEAEKANNKYEETLNKLGNIAFIILKDYL